MAQRGPRRIAVAASGSSLDRLIEELALPSTTCTLVVNGGTSSDSHFPSAVLTEALQVAVTEIVRHDGSVIVSGGTDAGLFSLLGDVIGRLQFGGPVVGVVPAGRVDRPDGTPLEPHHTHVVFVNGDAWGDETPTMLDLCRELDRRGPVVAVVAGGGEIVALEIAGHQAAGRPVIVLTGTGRLADDLAAQTPRLPGVSFVDVGDVAAQRAILKESLRGRGPGRPAPTR